MKKKVKGLYIFRETKGEIVTTKKNYTERQKVVCGKKRCLRLFAALIEGRK